MGIGERLLRWRWLSAALVAVSLVLVVGLAPARAMAAGYPDVARGSWYYDAVLWAQSHGVMGGYADGRFGPDDPLTREQAASVLYNYLGRGAAAPAASRSDVDQGAWYAKAVNWAVDTGTMRGYAASGTFGVGGRLTREELCATMSNACDANPSSASKAKFNSLADHGRTSPWARDAVAWAVDRGVVNGYSESNGTKTLRPQAQVTRAQMASIMKNAVDRGLLKRPSASSATRHTVGDLSFSVPNSWSIDTFFTSNSFFSAYPPISIDSQAGVSVVQTTIYRAKGQTLDEVASSNVGESGGEWGHVCIGNWTRGSDGRAVTYRFAVSGDSVGYVEWIFSGEETYKIEVTVPAAYGSRYRAAMLAIVDSAKLYNPQAPR